MADSAENERRILKAALGRTSQCPSLEVLAAISEEPASSELNEHLAVCARCQTELALLREFQEAAAQPGEIASLAWIESELRRRSPEIAGKAIAEPQSLWSRVNSYLAPTRWRTLSAVAASLLLAMTVGVYLKSGAGPGRGTQPPVYRSVQFSALTPAGDILEAPKECNWQPVAGATRYQVRLMEVDRTEIWSAESANTSVSIPPAVRMQMRPGRTFFWSVVARNAANEKIADSNLQNFHISATTR